MKRPLASPIDSPSGDIGAQVYADSPCGCAAQSPMHGHRDATPRTKLRSLGASASVVCVWPCFLSFSEISSHASPFAPAPPRVFPPLLAATFSLLKLSVHSIEFPILGEEHGYKHGFVLVIVKLLPGLDWLPSWLAGYLLVGYLANWLRLGYPP